MASYPLSTADAQLRVNAFISRVYMWMMAGLLLTGAVAATVARLPSVQAVIFGNPFVFFGLIIAQFALVLTIAGAITRLSATAAAGLFILYAALNGVVLSSIFLQYTQASIASAFFVTAGLFGVMSVVGYTTKRDLTKLGGIMFMLLIGVLIATFVNFFLRSEAIYWLLTYLTVFVFVGLTAADTQKIKRMAETANGAENLAILGALTLYLDFINLFLAILRIFGRRN